MRLGTVCGHENNGIGRRAEREREYTTQTRWRQRCRGRGRRGRCRKPATLLAKAAEAAWRERAAAGQASRRQRQDSCRRALLGSVGTAARASGGRSEGCRTAPPRASPHLPAAARISRPGPRRGEAGAGPPSAGPRAGAPRERMRRQRQAPAASCWKEEGQKRREDGLVFRWHRRRQSWNACWRAATAGMEAGVWQTSHWLPLILDQSNNKDKKKKDVF